MEKLNSYYKKHMVLVHGACHGAWVWYKVKPLLEAAGHRVTVLDMAASGTHPKNIHDLQTIHDYSEPLIQLFASLPDDQKVILVGHSFGGINIAMVMEMFPHKIEIAIFVGAFLPDTQHTPSFIFDQLAGGGQDYWLDTEFEGSGDPKETFTTMLFGPQYLAKRLYQFSPPEDFELVMTLKRTSSLFLHDLWKPTAKLTKERYGSVRTVYVICDGDQGLLVDFQRWMIENHGVKEVKELEGSDHMPMFCMPKKLCDCFMDIIAQN